MRQIGYSLLFLMSFLLITACNNSRQPIGQAVTTTEMRFDTTYVIEFDSLGYQSGKRILGIDTVYLDQHNQYN